MSALTASVQFYNRRVVKTKLGKEFRGGKMARICSHPATPLKIRSHPATPRGPSEPVITRSATGGPAPPLASSG